MEQGIHVSTACFAGGLPETAKKERPILFSGPMVRAILEGRKTQTRRIVKPQPTEEMISDFHRIGGRPLAEFIAFRQGCPFGNRSCRLWVRENGWERPLRTGKMMREGADTWPRFAYDADGWSEQDHADFKAWGFKRRPSIHMPRWASRIRLEVVRVRVERLNDISEEDAQAEGAPFELGELERLILGAKAKYRSGFVRLWESINGAGSWALNPWVWVVEFKRGDQ